MYPRDVSQMEVHMKGEKRKSLYEITGDIEAAYKLVQDAVDEDGNPRELTEDEMEFIRECFNCSQDEFVAKFDNYCKFIRSLKLSAENADSERKNFKSEMDRLSKRAKVAENTASRIQGLLRWGMERLGMAKYKTDLFSAGIQNTQLKVEPRAGSDLSTVPERFLKPRELDTSAIKAAIKAGDLVAHTEEGLNYGKVFNADGEQIVGLFVTQGTALVIR